MSKIIPWTSSLATRTEGPRSFTFQSNSSQTIFSTMLTTSLFVVLISFCFAFLFSILLPVLGFTVHGLVSSDVLWIQIRFFLFPGISTLLARCPWKSLSLVYLFIEATSIVSRETPRELAGEVRIHKTEGIASRSSESSCWERFELRLLFAIWFRRPWAESNRKINTRR